MIFALMGNVVIFLWMSCVVILLWMSCVVIEEQYSDNFG